MSYLADQNDSDSTHCNSTLCISVSFCPCLGALRSYTCELPSRRRPARRAAAAASNESGSGSDISALALADLLRRLQTASKTKTRCTAALQALIDGHCPRPSASSAIDIDTAAKAAVAAMEAKTATGASGSSASGENEDVDAAERASQDASLIPLTTHVLQRLLTLLRDHASTTASASAAAASAGAKGSESKKKKSKSTSKSAAAADANEEEEDDEANQLQVQVAVVTIALSYSLTQLLLADRPRLEKCAHHTTPPASVSASVSSKGGSAEDATGCDARSLVGRAIVASSLSSLAGLEVLVKYGLVRPIGGGDDDDDDDLDQTRQRPYMSLLRSSAWSALRTMERLTHINLNPPSAVSPSGSGVQHSQVGYASPSVHYHASVASSDTVQAWRGVLKELCRGTELHLPNGEKVGEDGAEDDDAESADQMDVDQDDEEEEDADVKNDIASLIEEVCVIASDAASEKFPGEMEVLYAAINRISIDPTAAAATSSGSKSKSSNKRPTRKAGKKRGASSQSSSGTASAAAISLLSALHDSHRIVFDGRIAIRRWTPMSLVWFGGGQKALLDLATTILRSETEVDDGDDDGSGGAGPMSWSTVLAPLRGGMLEWSGNDGTTSSTGNKRKRRSLSPRRGSDGDGSDGDAPPKKRSKAASGGKKRAAARSSSNTNKKGTTSGSKTRPVKGDDDVSEGGEDPAKVTVPGNVALVAFASRLVDLANEIGLTCGAKAPVGGMEAYALGILEGMSGNGKTNKEGSRSKQKKKKSSKKASSSANTFPSDSIRLPGGGPSFDDSWIRPDLRHEASALIRRILSVHSRCLRENFNEQALLSTGKRALPENGDKGDSNGSGRYLVNDDVLSGPQQLRETALCFPFMPRTLDVLARCAASTIPPVSSASSSNSPTEVPRDSVSTCMSKMMALASALAIGGGSIILSEENDDKDGDEGCFVIADARLSSMAVSTLMDCVKRIATTSSTSSGATSSVSGGDTSGSMPAELVQLYHLDKPLIPSSGGELNESAKVDGFCSYGGALILPSSAHSSSSASAPGDDGLGTLMGITSSASGSSGQRHGGCLEDGDVLALFLRAMLDPSGDHQHTAEECVARLLTQILRIVRCCYTQVSDFEPVDRDSDVQAMEKMAFAKSALAADALDALRKSLLIRPSSSSISSSKDRLRRCLRSCGLQLDHMRRLIDCSCSMENFFRDRVYSSRQAHKNKIEKEKTDERNANSDAEAVLDASTRRDKSCNEYDPAERRLW